MLGLVELALPEQAGELTSELMSRGGLPQGFVSVGSMARYALIEAQENRWQPPRDIDIVGIEEFSADMELAEQVGRTGNSFGVDEEETPILVPSLESWFANSVDFNLNAVGIPHTEEGVRIVASEVAIDALETRKLSFSTTT